jgi:hypothetical protein
LQFFVDRGVVLLLEIAEVLAPLLVGGVLSIAAAAVRVVNRGVLEDS